MNRPQPTRLPYLTHGLSGIRGRLKSSEDDFFVEEIPAYEPCGEGEFVFVGIEKRGLNTRDALQRLASYCGVREQEASSAGLKDKHAVTRQVICLPARCETPLAAFSDPLIEILWAKRHRNKLKTGHLRGNRFAIVVREVSHDALVRARVIRDVLLKQGFPNYFGEQRFGTAGDNASDGFALLAGGNPFRKMSFSQKKFLTKMALSAAQSELFNRCLSERLRRQLFLQVQLGDVMQVTRTGGQFVVEDVAAEQARFEAGETAVSGPLFGPKMMRPGGEPGLREETVLLEAGVSEPDFLRHKKLTQGSRRPYRVLVETLDIEPVEGGLRFDFTLPKGVYATCLLRELMKSD